MIGIAGGSAREDDAIDANARPVSEQGGARPRRALALHVVRRLPGRGAHGHLHVCAWRVGAPAWPPGSALTRRRAAGRQRQRICGRVRLWRREGQDTHVALCAQRAAGVYARRPHRALRRRWLGASPSRATSSTSPACCPPPPCSSSRCAPPPEPAGDVALRAYARAQANLLHFICHGAGTVLTGLFIARSWHADVFWHVAPRARAAPPPRLSHARICVAAAGTSSPCAALCRRWSRRPRSSKSSCSARPPTSARAPHQRGPASTAWRARALYSTRSRAAERERAGTAPALRNATAGGQCWHHQCPPRAATRLSPRTRVHPPPCTSRPQ